MYERLDLLLLTDDDSTSHPQQRRLTVAGGDIPFGCTVASKVLEQLLLTSVHEITLEEELWSTTAGEPRLTRDNPFLDEHELAQLDEQGLIPSGTLVIEDQVLASIVSGDRLPDTSGRRPEKGMQWVSDRTLRVPPGWEGATVVSARVLKREDLGRRSPRGLLGRIEVALRVERSLEVGDLLEIGDQFVVVSQVNQDEAVPEDSAGQHPDIVIPRRTAEKLGMATDGRLELPVAKVGRAADLVVARSVGPYSLITQCPLGRPPYGGQNISIEQIAWLQERDLFGLIGEFTSLKCDDLVHREQLHDLRHATSGEWLYLDRPAAPHSLSILTSELTSLGLSVELQAQGDCVALKLSPADPTEILSRSGGEVRKPETIEYRTYLDTKDGLFGPNIFGPTNHSRRLTFGHFNLAVPTVPMLWRVGDPSVLSQALGLANEEVEQVLRGESDLVWDEGSQAVKLGSDQESNSLGSGGEAIAAAIQRRKPSLPEKLAAIADRLTTNVLAVMPPDLRPIVLLDSGNFATSDLNDLYLEIINRSNRLRKLQELDAPAVIIDNECTDLQIRIDRFWANGILPEAAQSIGSAARPLKDLSTMLFDRLQDASKTVDWSGAARVVVDTDLEDTQVRVPTKIFETLRLSSEEPCLLTCSEERASFVAAYPSPHPLQVISVTEGTYQQLVDRDDRIAMLQIHRPITHHGRNETYQLLESVEPSNQLPQARGWLSSETPEQLLENLARAAVTGESLRLDSPLGLAIGGTGSTEFAADGEKPDVEGRKLVPTPKREEPKYSEPTLEEMATVARSYLRKACTFEVQEPDEPPPPQQGRIGGEPFLPADIEWPRLNGKPLTFLGQFPLDPARDAGLLPIDVPPGSMLTVFLKENCWEPTPCPAFVHSIENLSARPAPDDLEYEFELCEIIPNIVEEIPSWAELSEILEWDLKNPKPTLLKQFQEEVLPTLPVAVDMIKLGGFPHWIQNADTEDPLLLQLTSHDETDIMFGDSGSLYIFAPDNENIYCFTQCY